MTIVGKIMVWVVLVLSLASCAFGVMSYASRIRWVESVREYEKQYRVSQKNSEQFYQEWQKAKGEADARVAAVEAREKALRDEVEGSKTQLAAAAKKVQDAETRFAQAETAAKAAQADVTRRQADVEKMRDTLATEINRNTQLVKDANNMRDRAVSAEIQVKSLKDTSLRMEGQLQEQAKEIARLKQNVGSSSRSLASGSNPPPENVEGRVTAAGTDGLLQLSIGSDAGLASGHTLELFRTQPRPTYLGKVRVIHVTPHEAVAQPLGKMNDKPQVGDRVASRILGGA